MSDMEQETFIRQKRAAILQFLELAERDLDKAEKRGNKEGVATYTFLVQEYLTMLEEFDEHYGIQTIRH